MCTLPEVLYPGGSPVINVGRVMARLGNGRPVSNTVPVPYKIFFPSLSTLSKELPTLSKVMCLVGSSTKTRHCALNTDPVLLTCFYLRHQTSLDQTVSGYIAHPHNKCCRRGPDTLKMRHFLTPDWMVGKYHRDGATGSG